MSNDVLITPASRKIEFKDSGGNVDAKIETDASGNLNITNAGGDISLGDTTSDVFIGDGTNSVDIVFEQNGEIRGTSGVTLTLGDSNTTLRTGTDLSLNSNDITNVGDISTTTVTASSTLNAQDGLFSGYVDANGLINGYMFRVDDTTVIDASRNLTNIGTVSSGHIDVTTSGVQGIRIKNDTSATTNSGRLFFEASGGTFAIMNTTNRLSFRSGATYNSSSGTERMVIKSDGKVGIGTDSPSLDAGLHVRGSTAGSGETITNLSGLLVENNGSSATYYVFQTATAGGGKSFSITNAGDVGIGTTAPADKVEIRDNHSQLRLTDSDDNKFVQFSYSGNKLVIRNNNSSTSVNQITLDSIGSLGVGTMSPNNQINTGSWFKPESAGRFVSVNSSSGGFLMLESSTVTNDDQIGGVFFTATAGQSDAHRQVAAIDAIVDVHGSNTALNGADLRFFTKPVGAGANVPRMIIRSNGKVGINKEAPAELLEVRGNSTDGWIRLSTSSGNPVITSTNNLSFKVGSTNELLYLENTNSRVGIGVTSPTFKLHVRDTRDGDATYNGGILVENTGSQGEPALAFKNSVTGSNMWLLGCNQDSDLHFAYGTTFTDGNAKMTVKANGDVFIGAESAGTAHHKLDVYSNENVPLRIHRPSNANLNSTGAWGIGFSTRSDAAISSTDTRAGIFSYYNGNMFLATGTSSIVADPDAYARLTVLASGNIGIGTMTPDQKLDVRGNVVVGAGGASDYNRVYFKRYGGASVGAIGWHSDAAFYIGGHPNYGSTAGNAVRVYGFGSDLHLGDNSNGDVVTIKYSNGNVGIGTSSPATPLHMYKGSVGSNTGVTDMLRIEINRNDHGATPSGPAILFKDQDTNNNTNEARIKMMTVNDTDYGDNDEAASNLLFETTNGGTASDKMIITGRGNVGIGTVNPATTLQVSGKTTITTTGTGNSPGLAVDLSNSTSFVHGTEVFAGNLTAGQSVINVVGRTGNTKNSGYIGYYWGSAGSNDNFVSIGHWGNDHLLRIYGGGNVSIQSGALLIQGNTSIYKSGNYMIYCDAGGGAALYAGNNSDNRNYYQSNHHRFRDNAGTTNFAELSSAGLHIGGISTPSEKLQVTGNAKITGDATINSQNFGSNGNGASGMGFGYKSATFSRPVGTGVQWIKIGAFSGGTKTLTVRILSNGDNTTATDVFVVSLASYGFKANILKLPSTKYNSSKLEEVRTKWVSGATYELWIKMAAITTSAGSLYVSMNDSGCVSTLSAGTEPTVGSNDATLPVSPADRGDYAIQATNQISSEGGYAVGSTTRINSVGDIIGTSYYVGGSNIVDTSRNLTNIGTISSGAITSSGNFVGTGTTNTFYSGGSTGNLSVGRGSTQALHLYVDDNNCKITADQDADSNGNHSFILDRTFDGTGESDFEIRNSGSTQLVVDKDGNVGIGLNPNQKLHVAGSIATSSGSITSFGNVTTGNGHVDGKAGFRVNGTEVISSSRNLTNIGTISSGAITLYTTDGATATDLINLPRGGGITFYGNAGRDHSIQSRSTTGGIADDIRINSYAGVYINLDSNSNNTSNADFIIGRHGAGTGTMSTLLTVSGETGSISHSYYTLDNYTSGTVPISVGRLTIKSAAKTGWGSGDELGSIDFYNSDTSGIGARTAARIVAENNQGNGSSTTTFHGELGFYTSAYNTALRSDPTLILQNDNSTRINGNLNMGATTVLNQSRNLQNIVNITATGRAVVGYIRLANKEASQTDGSEGTLLYDANFYSDTGYGTGSYSCEGAYSSNGGGLVIKGQDGYAGVIDTRNMQWLHFRPEQITATGNITAYSDERLKDNIETLDGSKVYEMRGVSYTKDGKAGSGVIAQELEKVAPELVQDNDEYKSVAYGNIVGYLIEALKEQKAQIDNLTKMVNELKEK